VAVKAFSLPPYVMLTLTSEIRAMANDVFPASE
jgi:hypothetical protein